jgi:hypothetical protein
MTVKISQVVGSTKDAVLRHATLSSMGCHGRTARIGSLRGLSPDQLHDLRGFAVRNRVGPIVAHAVRDAWHGEAPEAREWEALHRSSEDRMRVLMTVLDDAATALAAEGIVMVALKNAGIARGLHDCPACCPMGDLDVLINPSRFREAHAILLATGFELASRSVVEPADLEHGLLSGGTEYIQRVGGHEVWFELQWRPVAGRWIRRDQEPAAADLISRSIAIEGSDVRLLAPEDNLLQVCLHTTKHSYVRAPGLRLHTDVDRIVSHQEIDWIAFLARARAMSSETACFLSLQLAATLLDTPIPPHVLAELRPNSLKLGVLLRWIRRADVFEPDAPKFSRPEMLGFHALLYDDATGLLASVLDVEPGEVNLRHLPSNLRRGARRVWDVMSRYQR